MTVVGVDEAGKGPVLGSMFAAAIRAPSETALPPGIDDSKRLSPKQREALWGTLQDDDRFEIAVTEIPVSRIDDPTTDMNTLTVEAHVHVLASVIRQDDRVILDAGDTSAARFGRRVGAHLDVPVDLHAEHGADGTHTIVGAASIAAKVTRDAHVAELADEYGELGSGYPSDPATRTFLREYVRAQGRLPGCARTSWSTSKDALAAAAQSALSEF